MSSRVSLLLSVLCSTGNQLSLTPLSTPELPRPWLTPSAAILHTIFFHRYFTSISPLTRDLLDLTLPAIDDVDLETLIEQKTFALVRAIDSTHQPRGRAQIAVQFFEKKRRKTYFFGKADEDVCWEQWTLDVTLAQPRTETGMSKTLRCIQEAVLTEA